MENSEGESVMEGKFEILKPDKKIIELAEIILRQNNQILGINTVLIENLCKPIPQPKGENE